MQSNPPKVSSKKSGFTLIELSIVLVIIGLIAGGVLVGRDLIEAAKTRKVISRFEEFTVAHYTFRAKYNCMAGDCKDASQFGLGTSGNGDRKLNGVEAADNCESNASNIIGRAGGECQRFWVHLAAADLLGGQYSELANSGPSILNGTEVGEYFPSLIDASSYVYLINYKGKFYFRTGLNQLASAGSLQPVWNTPALNGSQIAQISEKYSVDVATTAACSSANPDSCPDVFASMSVIPLSWYNSGGNKFWYSSPVNSSGGSTPCVNYSGGNVTYRDDGQCNLLWQMK